MVRSLPKRYGKGTWRCHCWSVQDWGPFTVATTGYHSRWCWYDSGGSCPHVCHPRVGQRFMRQLTDTTSTIQSSGRQVSGGSPGTWLWIVSRVLQLSWEDYLDHAFQQADPEDRLVVWLLTSILWRHYIRVRLSLHLAHLVRSLMIGLYVGALGLE